MDPFGMREGNSGVDPIPDAERAWPESTHIETADPDRLDQALLAALREGFRQRAGAKERFQALSEYELARRVGVVDYGYVAYDSSREHEHLRAALGRLQRRGLVHAVSVSGRYETFVPAATDAPVAGGPQPAPAPPSVVVASAAKQSRLNGTTVPTLEARLDEVIRLLRSIDERLGRIERG